MSQKTRAALTTQAAIIRDEPTNKGNTKGRVYTMLKDIIDSAVNVADDGSGTPVSSEQVTVKVSVSSAEILALFTTPKTLVAAPGAGKRISIDKVHFVNNFGTAAYATNTDIGFTGGTVGNFTANGVLGQSGNYFMSVRPASSLSGSAGLPSTNQSVTMYSLFGNPTAGDGTLDVYITYSVLTF